MVKPDPPNGMSQVSGGDGSRTHDLYIANVALCQLSYTPERILDSIEWANSELQSVGVTLLGVRHTPR